MSQLIKNNLAAIASIVGISIGVFGFIQAYAVLPYRMEQNEKAVKVLQEEAKTYREILIRIEERLKRVQEDLSK